MAKQLSNGTGVKIGQSTTDTVGFYGNTPLAQIAGAAQASVTDNSGGAAAATNGIVVLSGTYNSTILSNNFATIIAQGNALRAALVSLGLIKGAA